jgi:cytochrome P450
MIQATSYDINELTLSPWEWCGHVLVDAAPRAFFGDAIYKISPDLKDFFVFDEQPVTIGGKTLLPNYKASMPYKQMHFNPIVFGANAADFDPRRFLNNKSLVRSISHRLFGGAATYRPGRFLARREIYMFVILAIHRFDIELDTKGGEAKFPRLDHTILSGGVLAR